MNLFTEAETWQLFVLLLISKSYALSPGCEVLINAFYEIQLHLYATSLAEN